MTIKVLTIDSKFRANIGNKPLLHLKGGEYEFETSKVYAFVGAADSGGYALSCLLSGQAALGKNEVRVDGSLINRHQLNKLSCFIGSGQQGIFKKNLTVKRQIIGALDENENWQSYDYIAEKFGLTEQRADRRLAYTGNEHWRASIAIAYSARKRIYCSPFIDVDLWDKYLQLHLERWIRMLRDEDNVVLLPVSEKSRFTDLADEFIHFD